jgi:tetratricopeptide (TPR) repeat protein
MEDRQVAALYRQAEACRRSHNWHGAIELLKRVLALEPEHAEAHASLALALFGVRRLHAAATEVDLALGMQPDSPFCHYAAAVILRARRKLDDAYKHCLVAMEDDGHAVAARVVAASIKTLQNERAAAREYLLEALAISPTNSDALSELANTEYHDGNLIEASRYIDEALTQSPDNADAHVVAGYIALARGNIVAADGHVRYVLHHDASDHDALQLLAAIKARRNPVLGLWWRWHVFVGLRTERSQIGILLGSYLLVRLLLILLGETGHEDAELLVGQIWLAFCAYTWFAPAMFRWLLKRELETVTLRDDY